MKRIAEMNQRHLRWSLGCAHLGLGSSLLAESLPGSANLLVRRTYANLNDSCGSALV